jgi:signal transduction histidine kinase
MLYAFIIVLVIAIGLATGLYFQMKASHGQAEEQQKLLNDYQYKVDEQQKLLDDYRALEKNFDNIGEGYEQALLSFEKMEAEANKAKSANEALQKHCNSLQAELDALRESDQKKSETAKQVVKQMLATAKANGDIRAISMILKLTDLDDIQPDMPPIERTDNIMVAQVSDEAIKISGVEKSQFANLAYNVAPDAAATMLSTNQQKAVRALTHLLDNALKFTSEGTITLNVSVDMDKMQIIYAVEDSGTGIEAADAERIFEPYTKLNQFFDGQGIGLTVARNLARRLGGDITYDSAFAGPGSRFVLTLPM